LQGSALRLDDLAPESVIRGGRGALSLCDTFDPDYQNSHPKGPPVKARVGNLVTMQIAHSYRFHFSNLSVVTLVSEPSNYNYRVPVFLL